jgi:hypothetical protein
MTGRETAVVDGVVDKADEAEVVSDGVVVGIGEEAWISGVRRRRRPREGNWVRTLIATTMDDSEGNEEAGSLEVVMQVDNVMCRGTSSVSARAGRW